eukprot:UN29141
MGFYPEELGAEIEMVPRNQQDRGQLQTIYFNDFDFTNTEFMQIHTPISSSDDTDFKQSTRQNITYYYNADDRRSNTQSQTNTPSSLIRRSISHPIRPHPYDNNYKHQNSHSISTNRQHIAPRDRSNRTSSMINSGLYSSSIPGGTPVNRNPGRQRHVNEEP